MRYQRLTPSNCDDLLFDDVLWGVAFRGLFWREKASPPRLCGHHYDKRLDRLATATHDHALVIVRDNVGRANRCCRCKQSHQYRWRIRHGVGAEEVGL